MRYDEELKKSDDHKDMTALMDNKLTNSNKLKYQITKKVTNINRDKNIDEYKEENDIDNNCIKNNDNQYYCYGFGY